MILVPISEIKSSLSAAITSRNINLLSNLILSCALLIFSIAYLTDDSGAVAIPNAPLTEPIEVRGEWANKSFKVGHAFAFSELVGNLSPQNIDFVKQRFLASSVPALRQELGDELERQIAIIKARKIKQKFTIEDVYFDEYQDVVWVWGSKEITLPRQKPKTNIWTYEYRIGVSAGMPKIKFFTGYQGKPNVRQRVVPAQDSLPELDSDMREDLKDAGSEVKELKQ